MMHVLYAEDDPHVAEVVRFAFSHAGADIELDVTTTGRGCLATMQEREYDVLLLDLMLPDLDGLRVLSELAARRDTTPVIMVSGHGQHELAVRALRAGAIDCIDKSSPEFRRIPEIVRRVQARHPRRRTGALSDGALPRRLLFLDPLPEERDQFAVFLATSVPALQITTDAPAALESILRSGAAPGAVVVGPNVESGEMLAALRQLRAHDEGLPVIVISGRQDAETSIAAFKLGAHDFLLRGPDCYTELVFSLHHALRQADAERLNAELTRQLEALNQSLADQVAARTRDLENEIVVRREAEHRAEENAARLQALSTRLLSVQEEERHRLAQELHDQIGQLLTGLRFQLEAARDNGSAEGLRGALAVTDELLRSVRALTLQLRPRLLDDLGLRPALEWHAKTVHQQTGTAIELELSLPERRFSPQIEIAVFRMVQEALTNVARHSGANAAVVTVTADESILHVEVADRGRGFDAAAALARRDSLGLAGLAERVRLTGGRFEIFSQAGQGTRLHAEFDLGPHSYAS
ncbi:response regulator [Opitutus sp. ER46]|uniref:hybrid sensor histidine kinase/response regulator n=1 Tax=Opitutus sp. ER46 TaxID=2161864 RepID=UPI000D31604D|nr:response regulator [Opitutus sp. ER46]PTX90862.1 hypothetical protein DB354_19620 [Opitutus sp. ER46]